MSNSTNVDQQAAEKRAKTFVLTVSIFLPLAVGTLYIMPKIEAGDSGLRAFLNHLPLLNASINGLTAFILVAALLAIRAKKIERHKTLMTIAMVLSVVFLLSYIAYHATTKSTEFPKDAPHRNMYLFILLTHILFSAIIVPLVLISYTRALAQKFDKHRRIAKLTWPLWFYVACTGVIVYLMISPYYGF
jgi:putative membrane protein